MHERFFGMNDLETRMKAQTLQYMVGSGFIGQGDTVVGEFCINRFKRRVDLVVFQDDKIIALEIKSENDSLRRLAGQVSDYLEYFDKVIIVSSTKHLKEVCSVIPPKVGVWEMDDTKEKIRRVRVGRLEKVKDAGVYFSMMKADELRKLARKNNIGTRMMRRSELLDALSGLSLYETKVAAIEAVKERYRMTSEMFWRHMSFPLSETDVDFLNSKGVRVGAQRERRFTDVDADSRIPCLDFGKVPEHIKNLIAEG